MKIKYVTLTGADNNTSVKEMFLLSERYPFIEWGILFSKVKQGTGRFPSQTWMDTLVREFFLELTKGIKINLSAHLCGHWVEDVTKGQLLFLDDCDMDQIFGRIQLNCNKERLVKSLSSQLFFEAISTAKRPVILGGNWSRVKDIEGFDFHRMGADLHPLFDASGGRGVLSEDWLSPVTAVLCGYAGGLGPDNLAEQLQRIEQVVGDGTVWVDMESRLRDEEEMLDLAKCERVAEIVQQWV